MSRNKYSCITYFTRFAFTLAGVWLTLTASAQTAPAWTSATIIGPATTTTTNKAVFDASGNSYVVGSFDFSIQVGGITLTPQSSPDGFVAKFSPTGTLVWVRQIGGNSRETATDVAVDATGNVYVIGTFRTFTSLSFGNNVSVAGPGGNYIVRYSPQGLPEWANKDSGNALRSFSGVETDAIGNVYIAGRYSTGSLGFGSLSISNGQESGFLARLTSTTGAVQRLQQVYEVQMPSSGGIIDSPGLAVAPNGAVYLFTNFRFPVNFNSTTRVVPRGVGDALIVRFSAQGTFEWVQRLGASGFSTVNDGTVDTSGNIYTVGSFDGGALVGTSPMLASTEDAYLLSYSPQGTARWAQSGGSNSSDSWSGVTLDASGNPYTIGNFRNIAQFGSLTLTSGGATDIAVAAYTSGGQVRWVQRAGGPNSDAGNAIGVDAANIIYAHCQIYRNGDFGTITLSSPPNTSHAENILARLGNSALNVRNLQHTQINLYPNPAHDQLHLPSLPAGSYVQLVDVTGRVVCETTVSATATVSVRGLRPALYTLRATDKQGQLYAARVAIE